MLIRIITYYLPPIVRDFSGIIQLSLCRSLTDVHGERGKQWCDSGTPQVEQILVRTHIHTCVNH